MKCDSMSSRSQHGSLAVRWRRWMTGYMGKCKQLGGRIVYRLFLLVLLAPNHAKAQTELPSATNRPRRAEEKTRKRHLPERTFVLVGAGDIASCKNPRSEEHTSELQS